jgi:hypothetical protein
MRTKEQHLKGVFMLLLRIEQHLRHHHMTPTRFGREAAKDSNLIAQLRDGRKLRSSTAQKIIDYLDENSSKCALTDRI